MEQPNPPEREAVRTRVRLTYQVENGTNAQECELPFIIGLVADFGGAHRENEPLKERTFIEVDSANFDAILACCEPVLRHRWVVPHGRHGGEEFHSLPLRFQSLRDFEPDAVRRKQPERANRILKSESYGRLVSAWYGLRRLVDGASPSPLVRILMLDVGKTELWHDMYQASSVSETALFRLMHNDVYSVRGQAPFSLLIADYEFGWDPDDLELLSKISEVAAAIHAPLLAEARPEMLHDDLEELNGGRAPETIFEACLNEEYWQAWKAFREQDRARFTHLLMPRVSAYCQNEEPLWGSAAYAIAGKLIEAFRTDGWFAAATGGEYGILDGTVAQVAMGEKRAEEWSEAGFCALASVGAGASPYPVRLPACWRSEQFDDDSVGDFVRYSAELPYQLTVCRLVQYLMVMARDGGRRTKSEIEGMLNRWLGRYQELKGEGGAVSRAVRPLRDSSLEVITKKGGQPERWSAVCLLRPAYLMKDFSRASRVVFDLPAPV